MKANGLIDWTGFTVMCDGWEENGIKHSSSFSDVKYVVESILKLPMDSFHSSEKRKNGYLDCVEYNNIFIYYNANSLNMGLNVSLSGKGCKTYEQHHPIIELIKRVLEDEECHFTRLDLAVDDKTGVIKVPFIIEEIRGRRLRSAIRRRTGMFDLEGKEKDEAATVYIGSPHSEVRFRIYDKAKEQGDFEGVWNRIEGVFKRKHADAVADLLINSGKEFGECVAEIFNDKIQFINLDDSNITRCSVAQWWLDFIETIKRLRLLLPEKPELSVDRTFKYFENMGATVCVLIDALGENVFNQIYERGKKKLKPHHLQMISDYKALATA